MSSAKLEQVLNGNPKPTATTPKKDKKVYPPQPFEGTFFLAPFKTGKGQPMFTGNMRIDRATLEEMMAALDNSKAPAVSVKCVAISVPTKTGQVINIFRDRGQKSGDVQL